MSVPWRVVMKGSVRPEKPEECAWIIWRASSALTE